MSGVDLKERAEADEVVGGEQFDFLAGLLCHDVFSCEAMNVEGALEYVELLFGRI